MTQTRPPDGAELLQQLMALPVSDRQKSIKKSLESDHVIGRIEELLPNQMKGQASRLVKRAMLTFDRTPILHTCTPPSFVRCVLEAAELGLAIDGKLCHAVPYNTKVKLANGREEWQKLAQCQPDYKGLIAVAKRTGNIVDAFADVICEHDHFEHGRSGPLCRLEHSYPLGDRGKVIGAYAVLTLGPDRFQYALMSIDELNAIKNRSKSRDRSGNVVGPWVSDENEMRKKTVLKRVLKLYIEDPGLVRAVEMDDFEYADDGSKMIVSASRTTSVRRSPLNDRIPATPRRPAITETVPDVDDEAGSVAEDEAEGTDEYAQDDPQDAETGEDDQDTEPEGESPADAEEKPAKNRSYADVMKAAKTLDDLTQFRDEMEAALAAGEITQAEFSKGRSAQLKRKAELGK